jgi:hypothetical protein
MMEKWPGTNGFITCQMGARPDAIPNAAGGDGGHTGCGNSNVLR